MTGGDFFVQLSGPASWQRAQPNQRLQPSAADAIIEPPRLKRAR
jgi:hypothetical protein